MMVKNEKGYALLITIFAIVIISIIGVGLLGVTANSNKITVHERQDQSLFYIAEAGINRTKADVIVTLNEIVTDTVSVINKLPQSERTQDRLEQEVEKQLRAVYCNDHACNNHFANYQDFSLQNGKKPIANVMSDMSCYNDGNDRVCEILLKSVANFLDDASNNRTVEQKLVMNLNRLAIASTSSGGGGNTTKPNDPTLFDLIKNFTAVSSNKTSVNDYAYIEGNAGSFKGISAVELNQKFDSDRKKTARHDLSELSSLDLNAFLPTFPTFPSNPVDFNSTSYVFNSVPNHLSCTFSNLGKPIQQALIQTKKGTDKVDLLDLSAGNYYKVDEIFSDEKLEIKIGAGITYLEVNSLNLKKEVTMSGSGVLKVIVTKSLIVKDEFNKNGDANKLTICYNSTEKLLFDDSSISIGGHLIVKQANVDVLNLRTISGDVYVNEGNVFFKSSSKITGSLYVKKGNLTINSGMTVGDIYVDSGTVSIDGSAKISNNYVQRSGILSVTASTDFKNIYLNNVNATFNNQIQPNIYGMFYVNDGTINIVKDIEVFGPYIQLKGTLNLSSRTGFFDNAYLDTITLNSVGSIKFKKNLYINNANLNLSSFSDVEGDTYVLNGDITAKGWVDYKGNVYYAGTEDVVFSKFVDAKKNKLVVAPNAKVRIEGSTDIKGIVLANDIYLNSNAYIKYGLPENIEYLINKPIPGGSSTEFTPLNDYILESPLIER